MNPYPFPADVMLIAKQAVKRWIDLLDNGDDPDLECAVADAIMEYRRANLKPISLTPRQRDCFEFIAVYIGSHGYPPTFREIEVHLGLHSKSCIARLIAGLEDRGAICRLPNRARAISITAAAMPIARLINGEPGATMGRV